MANNLEQMLTSIQNLYQMGKLEEAVLACRQLVKKHHRKAEPCVLLAKLEQSSGRVDAMFEALSLACKRSPKEVALKEMRADACMQNQKFALAASIYRGMLTLNPQNPNLKMRLAAALQELPSGIDEAIKLHRQLVNLAPKEAYVHYNLGTALKRKHDFKQALRCYQEAVNLAPKDVHLQMTLANLLFELKNFESAVDALNAVLALNPSQADALERLSYSYKMLLKPDASEQAAKELVTLVGEDVSTLSYLSSAQIAAGNYQAALHSCNRGLDIVPSNRKLLADKIIAISGTKDTATAAKLLNLDQLLQVSTIEVPEGYSSSHDFNLDLVALIDKHPTLDFSGSSHSCHGGATSNEVFNGNSTVLNYLLAAINKAVSSYRDSLSKKSEHPWLTNLPAQTQLNISGWVNRLKSQGYLHSHIHPTGWISGVYYVSLPPESGDEKNAGCIEFGRAPFFYPEGDQGQIKVVTPVEGTLVLFPSYFYHRTVPFCSSSERITLAFDFRLDNLL